MAVRSRAISRVPVTRRKMMKMLMILSRERSNHTIIWTEGREIERQRKVGVIIIRDQIHPVIGPMEKPVLLEL